MWDAEKAVEGTREWQPARDQVIFWRRRSWKTATREGGSEPEAEAGAEVVASAMIGEEALEGGRCLLDKAAD